MRFNRLFHTLLFFISLGISQAYADTYPVIDWVDLLPKDDLEALMNPPAYLDDIEDGSFEDQISSQVQNALETAGDSRYQQALASTDIVEAFNNRKIRIPGFIVPLEFDKNMLVTRFFVVPYFGACIHVPPPPPNQIIYGVYDQGLKQESLQDAYWLTGTLKTTLTENDVATSAYSLIVNGIEIYRE